MAYNDYARLSARERLARIVEASARDDFARVAALERSAPTVSLAVPHTHTLRQALSMIALLYSSLQLDHWAQLQLVSRPSRWVIRRKYQDEMVLGAHTICVYADAWRVFCGELGVDPEAALAVAPGAMILDMAERASRRLLPNFGKIVALLKKHNKSDATPITVSEIATAMRKLFNSWVEADR